MIAHHVAESAFGKDSGALGAAPDKLLSDLILPWILAPTDLKDRFFVGVVTVLKLVSLRRGTAVFEASCTESNAHNLG